MDTTPETPEGSVSIPVDVSGLKLTAKRDQDAAELVSIHADIVFRRLSLDELTAIHDAVVAEIKRRHAEMNPSGDPSGPHSPPDPDEFSTA
jgi:hypothetical protein